ncbi:MAG: NifB/NifX family molybdenum-iron cluster-binding protein [Deltaproteobacteria bacterium]|nr:NifB/NifX family molybdenum-iron cluster-binding protein [Deltaproteobacteria bacterium]
MKVALPRFGKYVAPCFEHTATICIFAVNEGRIGKQTDFTLTSEESLDRVRLLKDQGVDVLICGGIQDRFQAMVEGLGILVISWVSGSVSELLDLFVRGQLESRHTNREDAHGRGAGKRKA